MTTRRAFACLLLATAALTGSGSFGAGMRPESAAVTAAKVSLRNKQFVAALRELQSAAEGGDEQSAYLLGLVYANGLADEPSLPGARHWLQVAADKDYPPAVTALAGLAGPPSAPRVSNGDAVLARELLVWAVRHSDETTLATFIQVAGVDAADDFGRAPLAYAIMCGCDRAVSQLLSAGARAEHADRFGITALMLAAEGQSDAILQELLDSEGARTGLDAEDQAGNTALFYAARAGRGSHIESILAAGAAPGRENADGWNALDVAMKNGEPKAIDALRRAGVTTRLKPVVAKDRTGVDPTRAGELYAGWPPICIAASRDDADVVTALLAAGSRADELNPQGDTPLLIAAKYRSVHVIGPLLRAGADAGRTDSRGETAMGYAAGHADAATLDALLQKGVSPDLHGPEEVPPLLRAVRLGDEPTARRLMEAGADVNAKSRDGTTALMAAVIGGYTQITRTLLAAHALPGTADKGGRDALWLAAEGGKDEVVDMLLSADVASPRAKVSPVFAAVQGHQQAVLQRLLRKGFDPNARNQAGDTPLIAAAAAGDVASIRALVDGGAAVDAQNDAGNTALIVATREGNESACTALLKAGANVHLRNKDRIDAVDTAKRRHLPTIVAVLTNG